MAYPAEKQAMTVEAYKALERDTDVRHEFINGEAYAMADGSPEHARIQINFAGALWSRSRGMPCRPTGNDQKVFVPETGSFFYADVTIVCGGHEYHPAESNALTNPSVLVEILSPSTEDYDRGTKFQHYKRLPSLAECVLVSQDERRVEIRQRVEEGWLIREVTEGDVCLASLDLSIPLDEIYDLEGVRP